ncbi:unnamed protein product [Caenorhabditis nigoni]
MPLDDELIVWIAKNVFLFQFIISTIGLVLNVPHLLILLHNSMRTSSTNSIMIGIAICDLIVLSENVYERVQAYWFFNYDNPCVNDYKYWYLYSLHIGELLRTIFVKASFGLGVFLAFTRLVIMKAAGTTLTISKPLFGYLLILVLVGLSSVHSFYYFRIFNFNEMGPWEPEETHRTCRMILVMSIFYVVASTPAGITEYVELFVKREYNSLLSILVLYGTYFTSALVCLNASSHGIINFTMSSKYRQTVKKCLDMEKRKQGSTTSPRDVLTFSNVSFSTTIESSKRNLLNFK